MATNEEQEQPKEMAGEGEGEDLEFEDAVSELERVESRRRRIGAILGIGAFVLLAVSVVLIVKFRSVLFQPKMPIEESQREIVKETDDPQCRQMIADVTNIGNTFFAMEGRIEKHLPGEDLEAIRKIEDELATIEKRLDEAESFSHEATLRFDRSRKELNRWFGYVDNELRVLQDVADNQIERLESRPEETTDAGSATAESGDAGTSGAETTVKTKEIVGSNRPPAERRDGALVALHDAFENFRVWHSASLHPCGNADEDEQPWRPEDWDEKQNSKEKGSKGEAGD